MEIARSRFEITRHALRTAGPYLLIEILLPGGSLMAAMLYLYRRKYAKTSSERELFVRPMRTFLARFLATACFALAGCGGSALLKEVQPLESSKPVAEGKDDRIHAVIDTVILRNGAGAWARDAEWHEYLIRIRALSDESLEIREVAIFDALDHRIEPRSDRGQLVDGTREMERRYEQSGKVVPKRGTPRIAASVAQAIFSGPVGLLAVGVALPIYGVARLAENAQIDSEIQRRRTTLPVALPSGAEASVDLFFPTTPQSARTQVVYADRHGEHRLDIDTRQALAERQPPPPTLVSRVER